MRGHVFNDPDKLPTVFKQRHVDDEIHRLALLDHLDDVYYAGLLTRARIRTPEEIYGPPPTHVLVVCKRCHRGAVESKVVNGWTRAQECPRCHAWIMPETHRPQNLITPEELRRLATVHP